MLMNNTKTDIATIVANIDRRADWHCHILPGIDDGAPTLEESVAMGRSLASLGYLKVYCTPHQIKGGFSPSNKEVLQLIESVQSVFDREGIAISLQQGMEYYLDEYFPDHIDNILTLGDSRYVLVEPPWQGDIEIIYPALQLLTDRDYIPLIAHPERLPVLCGLKAINPGFIGSIGKRLRNEHLYEALPSELNRLIETGCRFQGNIGSFFGCYGRKVQQAALYLYRNKLYTLFGTDAHSATFIENNLTPRFPTGL